MRNIRKTISLLLILVLVVSMMPRTVLAAGQSVHSGVIEWLPNPLYPNGPKPDGLVRHRDSLAPMSMSSEDYQSMDDAAAFVRQQMVLRADTIAVDFYLDLDDPRLVGSDFFNALMDEAFAHTGNPKEGDYQLLSFGGCQIQYRDFVSGNRGYYSVIFYMQYYTTAAQEQELDAAVEQLLNELKLDGLSQYEKVRRIYEYMTENIRYDYANLSNPNYVLQYTAYAALIHKTSVCQGYSTLLYRLLLESGVECRSIFGDSGGPHAWNIVKLGDLYYNADATWDENVPPEHYGFFLKGDSFNSSHLRDPEYRTDEFHRDHPMSPVDYAPNTQHSHTYVRTEYAPTCTERGRITFVCECGDGYVQWTDDALGHRWNEGVITKEPTENAEGEKTFTCTVCGVTRTEPIAKLEHTHNYVPTVIAPTCTEGGYTRYTCACGASYDADQTLAVGHRWDEGVVTREPTENAEGEKIFTCTVCGGIRTEPIAKQDHTHSYVATAVTEPGCDTSGYTTYTCACGHWYNDDYTDAVGHRNETVETVAPTCTAQGYTNYRCARCGEASTGSYLPALGHDWVQDWQEGYQSHYTCTRCGAEEARSGETCNAHSYDTAVTQPTCTEPGYTTYTCKYCGESHQADFTDPTGHRYASIYALPTCTDEGYTIYVCSCGDRYLDDYVPALGHDYERTVTEPTYTKPGRVDLYCTRCEDRKSEEIPALGCPFTDVPEGKYYFEPVIWAVGRSITSGTSATLFSPDQNCTRGQVVTFLWRAAGCPEPKGSDNPFTDVKEGKYFYKAVLWAVENEITAGVGGGRFAPDDEVTRAQFVTFLWRWAGKVTLPGVSVPFTDVRNKDYFRDAVAWALRNGITAGTSATTFGSNEGCTRAQVVTFLYRYDNLPGSGNGGWVDAPEGVKLRRHELWQDKVSADLKDLPAWDSEASVENIRTILEACAPDSAFFLRWDQEDYMSWIKGSITADTDTATHETFHGFEGSGAGNRYYLGDGYYVSADGSPVFNSREITQWIPEENQTFRYDLYLLGNNDGMQMSNLGSMVHGMYGLLNEFNAYGTGMLHNVSMFDYTCAQGAEAEAFLHYVNGAEGNRQAYAEFRYWMLTYLLYARENYPEVYQGLMDNMSLRYAFTVVEGRFAENIALFESQLERIKNDRIPGMEDIRIEENWIWVGSYGIARIIEDYQKLMEYMERPEYQEIFDTFRIK